MSLEGVQLHKELCFTATRSSLGYLHYKIRFGTVAVCRVLMELHSILVTDCLITFLVHTKTVQEFPDPSFRALVMQYIQRCGKGRVWVRD